MWLPFMVAFLTCTYANTKKGIIIPLGNNDAVMHLLCEARGDAVPISGTPLQLWLPESLCQGAMSPSA